MINGKTCSVPINILSSVYKGRIYGFLTPVAVKKLFDYTKLKILQQQFEFISLPETKKCFKKITRVLRLRNKTWNNKVTCRSIY